MHTQASTALQGTMAPSFTWEKGGAVGELVSLPEKPLCCCRILDDALNANQHLDDCELRFFSGDINLDLLDEGNSDTSCSTTESSASTRRRKHRESMARLREKMRVSIASLELEERQLERTLRRTMNAFTAKKTKSSCASFKLQLAYYELVKEQIALHAERQALEATQAQQDKYTRLVARELDRTFGDLPEEPAKDN